MADDQAKAEVTKKLGELSVSDSKLLGNCYLSAITLSALLHWG